MKTKRIMLCVSVFLILSIKSFGQVNQFKVFDLVSVLQDTSSVSNINPLDTNSAATKVFLLSTSFKINIPDSVDLVYLMIGEQKDNSQFLNQTLQKVSTGGVNYLYDGSTLVSTFQNKNTLINKNVPNADLTKAVWVTVWAKHINGSLSAKNYFKIQ